MLLEFSVSNFRSIKDTQTLNMQATAYQERPENCFGVKLNGKSNNLLKSAVIYGPNGSGKSTVINALRLMRDAVLNSHNKTQLGDGLSVTPHLFDPVTREQDSEFEITIAVDGIRYDYGFRCNAIRFTEEWLIAYPNARGRTWFHRKLDPSKNIYDFKYSEHFEGDHLRKDWEKQTRENALYLSVITQFNNHQTKPVFEWFNDTFKPLSVDFISHHATVNLLNLETAKVKVLNFLSQCGLDFSDIVVRKKVLQTDELPNKYPLGSPRSLRESINLYLLNQVEIITAHEVGLGEIVTLEFAAESAGTQALFNFAGYLLNAIDKNQVLLIDELDTSLHPLLIRQVVELFHKQSRSAQLIFTTHDASLLSSDVLRRDQVWFTEKDANTSTQLYALADFKPRETEAIERGYLNGRYGAIPFLKNLDFYGQ
jgi:uncharacterized protein